MELVQPAYYYVNFRAGQLVGYLIHKQDARNDFELCRVFDRLNEMITDDVGIITAWKLISEKEANGMVYRAQKHPGKPQPPRSA